jgi:hypothetical protein
MLKCNLGLPDPLGVDRTAASVLTWNCMSGVASLQDTISPLPPTSETSLEWQSLITEGTHHLIETKVHSIWLLFPFFMCSVLLVISEILFFLLIVISLLVQWDLGRENKNIF